MTARILAFPSARARSPVALAGKQPAPLTPDWCAQHLPLVDAALDLLQADEAEFSRRCRLMADDTGRGMLDQLAGQTERLGAQLSDVGDALGMTACRIRDGMAALG